MSNELIEKLRKAADVKPEDCPELFEEASTAIESQAATIARYETTAENCDMLRDKVEAQAREIERLEAEVEDVLVDWGQVRLELAALKARPSWVVLPERMKRGDEGGSGEYGAAMIRGYNACLREVARLNQPASARQPVWWQFFQDGEWHIGFKNPANHRANTEAAGYPVRDLYAGPVVQPASAGDERVDVACCAVCGSDRATPSAGSQEQG